jgi:hypothetical protein
VPAGLLERLAAWIVPRANPAGAIYGLVSVAALMAAESGRHETYLDTAASAVVAALLYWLLHSYAFVLGRRLAGRTRLTPRALADAMVLAASVLCGAAVPIVAFLVAWLAGAAQETAVTIALWSAIASLLVFELVAGVRAHASRSELVLQATVGLALGVAVLALRSLLH